MEGRTAPRSQKSRAAAPHTAVIGLGYEVSTAYEGLEGKDKGKSLLGWTSWRACSFEILMRNIHTIYISGK